MIKFSPIAVSLFLLVTSTSSNPISRLGKRNLETWTPCATESCNSRQECVPDAENNMICACKVGWTGPTCSEGLDECATMDPCSFPGGYCVDRHPNEGQFACGCDTGGNHWRDSTNSSTVNEHGATECMDVDECTDLKSPCAPNATCTNTMGAFVCECDSGLVGDGFDVCAPAAPEELLPTCENGQCDLTNSYCDLDISPSKCRCLSGYFAGSLGLVCQDIDECEVDERNACHEHAECTNLVGSYSCKCSAGYKDVSIGGDGTDCRPIDECTEGGNDCDETTAKCIDLAPPQMWECVPFALEPSAAPSVAFTSASPSVKSRTIKVSPSATPSISISPSAVPTFIPMAPVALVLNLNSDGFGEETSYRLYDVVNERLLWSEGSVAKNAQIQEEITLDPRGCYFFLTHDLFIDGLCCSFGAGSVSLAFGGAEVDLYEFDAAVANGSNYEHMAHAYIGSGCTDAPFLPSALDSSCNSQCGSSGLQPSGCTCDCIMTDSRRSRNNQPAVAFGDCCPDYVAMCTSSAAPPNAGPSGLLEVSYTKGNDGTLPAITLFDKTGPIGSGSCDSPAGCEISIVLNSTGIICSDMMLRVDEDSKDWIFAEDVVLTVALDGAYVLNYEGNIFPSILSFDC